VRWQSAAATPLWVGAERRGNPCGLIQLGRKPKARPRKPGARMASSAARRTVEIPWKNRTLSFGADALRMSHPRSETVLGHPCLAPPYPKSGVAAALCHRTPHGAPYVPYGREKGSDAFVPSFFSLTSPAGLPFSSPSFFSSFFSTIRSARFFRTDSMVHFGTK